MDEIPEAIRVREKIARSKRSPLPIIIGGLLGFAIIGLLIFFASSFSNRPKASVEATSEVKPAEADKDSAAPEPQKAAGLEPSPAPDVTPNTVVKDNLLGHLPYEEATETDLESITADGSIRLHVKAATKFRQMQAAAAAEGISLVPISGYRSTKSQEELFFKIKEERVQDATTRAEVSAPPGYSEHHTGYAIDIGDGTVPEAHVEPEFENTEAFRWLQANAAKFSFELSFPPNNSQGISYEPWHWRYVGDRQSLETFYKVRKTN